MLGGCEANARSNEQSQKDASIGAGWGEEAGAPSNN